MWKYRIQIPNRLETRQFIKYSIPIVIQSMIFTLNGVLDNFMVGDIPGATGALRAVNSMTGILLGAIYATISAGGIVGSQYLTGGNKDQYNQTIRLRIMISLFFTLSMAILWFAMTEKWIYIFSKAQKTDPLGANIYKQAIEYGQIRAISWIIVPFSTVFTAGLREIGKGHIPLYTSTLAFIINLVFNYLFIYVLHLESSGAGWSTLMARASNLIIIVIYCYWKRNDVAIPLTKIFYVSKEISIQVSKRLILIILAFTSTVLITFRDYFYTQAFPPGGKYLKSGGVTVLSLTGSIYNVFLGVFGASASTVSIFVGRQLGEGNIQVAKDNSMKLKLFHSVFAGCLSIILFLISFAIPNMKFLLTDNGSADSHQALVQVQKSLWVIALFYPFWMWFITSYNSILAGGKTFLAALVDSTSSVIGTIWLVVMNASGIQNHVQFWVYYLIFFTSDFIKGTMFSIAYNKIDWAQNITDDIKTKTR